MQMVVAAAAGEGPFVAKGAIDFRIGKTSADAVVYAGEVVSAAVAAYTSIELRRIPSHHGGIETVAGIDPIGGLAGDPVVNRDDILPGVKAYRRARSDRIVEWVINNQVGDVVWLVGIRDDPQVSRDGGAAKRVGDCELIEPVIIGGDIGDAKGCGIGATKVPVVTNNGSIVLPGICERSSASGHRDRKTGGRAHQVRFVTHGGNHWQHAYGQAGWIAVGAPRQVGYGHEIRTRIPRLHVGDYQLGRGCARNRRTRARGRGTIGQRNAGALEPLVVQRAAGGGDRKGGSCPGHLALVAWLLANTRRIEHGERR